MQPVSLSSGSAPRTGWTNVGTGMSPQQVVAANAAIANNEKLFPTFEQRLASDDQALFVKTATRLSSWLDSEKAYYEAARPRIVVLIETAQATLRRQKGGDPNEPFRVSEYPPHLEPWTTAYTSLCNVLARYMGKFIEPRQRARLQELMTMETPTNSSQQRIQHTAPLSSQSAEAQIRQPEELGSSNHPLVSQPHPLPHSQPPPISNSSSPTQSTLKIRTQNAVLAPERSQLQSNTSRAAITVPVKAGLTTLKPKTTPEFIDVDAEDTVIAPSTNIAPQIVPKIEPPPTPPSIPGPIIIDVDAEDVPSLSISKLGAIKIPPPSSSPRVPPAQATTNATTSMAMSPPPSTSATFQMPNTVVPPRPHLTPIRIPGSPKLHGEFASSEPVMFVSSSPASKEKSKKIKKIISEDLAQSDLEWLKTRKRKTSQTALTRSSRTATPGEHRNNQDNTVKDIEPTPTAVTSTEEQKTGEDANLSLGSVQDVEKTEQGSRDSDSAVPSSHPPPTIPVPVGPVTPAVIDLTTLGGEDVTVDHQLQLSSIEKVVDSVVPPQISATIPKEDATAGCEEVSFAGETHTAEYIISDNALASSGIDITDMSTTMVRSEPTGHNAVAMPQNYEVEKAGDTQREFGIGIQTMSKPVPMEGMSPMDVLARSDDQLLNHPPLTRKRPRSPSVTVDSSNIRRRLDMSSRMPLQSLTNDPGPSAANRESVSEVDVMDFLSSVPLSDRQLEINVSSTSIPKTVRAPCKVQFGPEMTVIAAHRGDFSPQTITFEFDISDTQMSLISLWQNRKHTDLDISQSLCLSLACYNLADIFSESQHPAINPPLEQLILSALCSWPTAGDVTVAFPDDETESTWLLSPPFLQTSENLVDISRIIHPAGNSIKLVHKEDMSNVVFALHAHSPTLSQVKAVEEYRAQQRNWKLYLQGMARPLDAPIRWGQKIFPAS